MLATVWINLGLIVINEICQISRKKLAKSTDTRSGFCKLQEGILLTVINEIFKSPPHLDPFGQENYL